VTRPRRSLSIPLPEANLVPARVGGEQSVTREASATVPLSAPIATTSLAEKTQISIVQLVTITGWAGADRSSGAPRGERRGIPRSKPRHRIRSVGDACWHFLEALGTPRQADDLDDVPVRHPKQLKIV
jgi:hypothetical protein